MSKCSAYFSSAICTFPLEIRPGKICVLSSVSSLLEELSNFTSNVKVHFLKTIVNAIVLLNINAVSL